MCKSGAADRWERVRDRGDTGGDETSRWRAGRSSTAVPETFGGACGGGLDGGVGDLGTVRDEAAAKEGVDDLETVREDTADDACDTVELDGSIDGTLCNASRRSCIAAIQSRSLWTSSRSGEYEVAVVIDCLEFLVGASMGVICSITPREKAVRSLAVHFLTISSTWF